MNLGSYQYYSYINSELIAKFAVNFYTEPRRNRDMQYIPNANHASQQFDYNPFDVVYNNLVDGKVDASIVKQKILDIVKKLARVRYSFYGYHYTRWGTSGSGDWYDSYGYPYVYYVNYINITNNNYYSENSLLSRINVELNKLNGTTTLSTYITVLNSIITLINSNLYNQNNNPVNITVCHSSCHSSCHRSGRGRR